MDDLAEWYEVIRSLLPQIYQARLISEAEAIVVGSPYSDGIAYVTRETMDGCTPSDVIRSLERQLRPSAFVPGARREAC